METSTTCPTGRSATALIAADLGRRMHNPNDRRLRELRAKRERIVVRRRSANTPGASPGL
ncbi:hypothetical protein AB0H88_05920 [Nonomuraea sp. NPDC050680]|uniref:hypothetical protein n=1 Tax=Nonomuraea sp. NPDC050680 TaxID=3154630 RepID=UPI0033FBD605